MQRCIRDADGGRWIDSHDGGGMAPLPGHGDPSLEQHRNNLESLRDRDIAMVLEDYSEHGNIIGMDLEFRQVPAYRHRFAMRVRHGGWIWAVWQVGDRLLADSKSEWMDDMPTLGPPPEFALARFVHAPYPKGRP